MRRRMGQLIVALLLLGGTAAVPAGAHQSAQDFADQARNAVAERSGLGATSSALTVDNRPGRSRNLKVLGTNDFGGRGFNADVWAHENYAYIGTWGLFDFVCPSTGTVVADISNPTNPGWVATIPTEPGTQTNDVKVAKVNTGYFRGDLLAVSNEDCDFDGARGFELVDVTDPTNAYPLGRYGPAVTDGSTSELAAWGVGIHNLFIFEQSARVYVAAIVDFGELATLFFGGPQVGDVRFVDVTDPTNPQLVGDWGIVKNLGADPFDPAQFSNPFESAPHDVWVENGIAYVSYWDAGLVLLDVSNPGDPKFLSQTQYAPGEEGNTHVAVPARGGNLVIVGDEDFSPPSGGDNIWGFGRVFNAMNAPVQVATFDTGNVTADPSGGDFTMHNVIVRGNTAYVSWYSDGIVLFDISRPTSPRVIGSYVPPAAADPYGVLPTAPEMWGVYVQGALIFGSDMNSGLHVLKQTK